MESCVVLDANSKPLYWHTPPGRSSGHIPDTRQLWDVIWENRHNLSGIAHSHPGGGIPGPSHEDLTTFAAIEAALGRRLNWWITNQDWTILLVWVEPDNIYSFQIWKPEPEWVKELRSISDISTRPVSKLA